MMPSNQKHEPIVFSTMSRTKKQLERRESSKQITQMYN